jgi:hypothetical protein
LIASDYLITDFTKEVQRRKAGFRIYPHRHIPDQQQFQRQNKSQQKNIILTLEFLSASVRAESNTEYHHIQSLTLPTSLLATVSYWADTADDPNQ